jgi:7,8-dihydropterin-6-yl-methyl-4-(beta-D-ribofuranosyl)aminobenzene 5'-phosphate synthase
MGIGAKMISITIAYDNTSMDEAKFRSDWGFSCVVEVSGKKILFDTGAKPEILLENLEKLQIHLSAIDEIFISHHHWDHTGGLKELYKKHPCKIFIPPSFNFSKGVTLSESLTQIGENIYSTGEIKKVEQSPRDNYHCWLRP